MIDIVSTIILLLLLLMMMLANQELEQGSITRFEQHDLGSSATARCRQRRLPSACDPCMSLRRAELRYEVMLLLLLLLL